MSQFGTRVIYTLMFSTSRWGGNRLCSHKPKAWSPSMTVSRVARGDNGDLGDAFGIGKQGGGRRQPAG